VEAIPGVRSASLANVSPTKPESGADAGPLQSKSGEPVAVAVQMVYPGYFETLGESMLRGRDFVFEDLRSDSDPVCIVNEAFADLAFAGEDPVGKSCLTVDDTPRIVGVVRDCQYTNLKTATQPVVYQPFLQADTVRGQMILHVRAEGPTDSIIPRVREEVWKTDKDVPQYEVWTLAEELDAVLIQERLITTLISGFGALALLLACVGLYGLFSFAVIQRTGELGLRIALGAMSRDVVWMILREAMVLVAIGIAIWIPIAVVAGRAAYERMSGLSAGLKPVDSVTIVLATGLLLATAVLAAYIPAWRASRIDPVAALKND
jgi:predicted permease